MGGPSPSPEPVVCLLVRVGEGREAELLCLYQMRFLGTDGDQGTQQSHLLLPSLHAVKLGRPGKCQ